MFERGKLRVHVECDNLQADLEGSPDEVTTAFIDFLHQIYPSFKLASRLIFKPDLAQLSHSLEGLIEYSQEGLILLIRELTSEEAILIVLLAVYVGSRLGLISEDTISVNQIANVSGKASKTILNQIKSMRDTGLLERVGKGRYQIKSLGIKRVDALIPSLKGRETE